MKYKILSWLVFSLLFFYSNIVEAKNIRLKDEFRKIVKVYTNSNKDPNNSIIIMASAIPITDEYILTAGHFCEAVISKVINQELESAFLNIDFLGNGDEKQTIDKVEIFDYVHNDNNDICILKKKNHNLKKVKFSKYYDYLEFGNKIYTVGCALGFFPPIITEGYITSIYTQEYPDTALNQKLMISSSAAVGNSGGAIFNSNGEFIGILVLVNPQYHHIAFAIPMPKILEYLNSF